MNSIGWPLNPGSTWCLSSSPRLSPGLLINIKELTAVSVPQKLRFLSFRPLTHKTNMHVDLSAIGAACVWIQSGYKTEQVWKWAWNVITRISVRRLFGSSCSTPSSAWSCSSREEMDLVVFYLTFYICHCIVGHCSWGRDIPDLTQLLPPVRHHGAALGQPGGEAGGRPRQVMIAARADTCPLLCCQVLGDPVSDLVWPHLVGSFTMWPGTSGAGELSSQINLLCWLEGKARYAGLLLAPAERDEAFHAVFAYFRLFLVSSSNLSNSKK